MAENTTPSTGARVICIESMPLSMWFFLTWLCLGTCRVGDALSEVASAIEKGAPAQRPADE